MGPRESQVELKKKYKVDVPYGRVFKGKEKALDIIYGKWDDSYEILPTYQAELLKSMPGSVVDCDTKVYRCLLQAILFFSKTIH